MEELQGLKTLKVVFHHATEDEVVIQTIRFPKQSTVGDVLDDLKTKVELSHPNAELRLLEIVHHKIHKVFPLYEKIERINDQWTFRAEEIPEEEKNLGAQDRLIHVYHFTKDTVQNQMQIQNFGEPFFLVIHEGETLAEIKVRIQKKLQVPDDEFAKWKFAFFSLGQGQPEYLQDSDIVSSRFQRIDIYGAWAQYLGLEHTDNAPKRAYAVNQVVHFRSRGKPKEDNGHIPRVKELELLVSSNHLAKEDVPLLTEFLLKYPCVRFRDEASTNKYRGFSYGCLAELLRFLGSCSVIDAAGDRKQELDDLVANVRCCAFSDHSWLARFIPSFGEC